MPWRRPRGGMHFSTRIATIESPTAQAAASIASGINRAQVTPIAAEMPCPASTGQGCDSAPCGTPKTSTTLAPIEAMSIAAPDSPSTEWLTAITSRMPSTPPAPETAFSFKLAGSSSVPSHSTNRATTNVRKRASPRHPCQRRARLSFASFCSIPAFAVFPLCVLCDLLLKTVLRSRKHLPDRDRRREPSGSAAALRRERGADI